MSRKFRYIVTIEISTWEIQHSSCRRTRSKIKLVNVEKSSITESNVGKIQMFKNFFPVKGIKYSIDNTWFKKNVE